MKTAVLSLALFLACSYFLFANVDAAALSNENSFSALESVALQRQRRSTNETSSSDEDSGISASTAKFVLNLVLNIATAVYNIVISDFGAAASNILAVVNLVLQYVFSSI